MQLLSMNTLCQKKVVILKGKKNDVQIYDGGFILFYLIIIFGNSTPNQLNQSNKKQTNKQIPLLFLLLIFIFYFNFGGRPDGGF